MGRWLGFSVSVLVFFLAFLGAGCETGMPLYESCVTVDDCNDDADNCFTVAWEVGRSGAMCSSYCSEHADCPGNSSCWELVGDPTEDQRVCYLRCETDLDCGAGFQCVDAEMGGAIVDAICLPN
ncbi:MAG: hypothetical protein JRH11_24135 [Deltaproteobacteria bacterium]|nr:hypothetical protein [Deltaproteobacteria bacterium]